MRKLVGAVLFTTLSLGQSAFAETGKTETATSTKTHNTTNATTATPTKTTTTPTKTTNTPTTTTATTEKTHNTNWAPEVTLDELKKIVETKTATIIDANGIEMYNTGHIPGAVSFAQNQTNFTTILPKDKTTLIVTYCGGPMCTAWEDAAKKAKSMGYTNIKHFKGGMKTWKEKGLAVEKGQSNKAG